MARVIPDLSMLVVGALPAAADHPWQFRVQGGKAWLSDGAQWIQLGEGQVLYPKKSVHTTSGTFTLPATAMPGVRIVAVGGACSGGGTPGVGSSTTVEDALSVVLVEAEAATASRPGRGGGVGGQQIGGSSAPPGNPGMRGRLGFGNGGGAGRYGSAGTGIVGASAVAGTGDGGGGNAATSTASTGGHGGGVEDVLVTLVPGDTYTHTIGAGGSAPSGTYGDGASGRVEYHYLDTVP